jgi:hypothetical protein
MSTALSTMGDSRDTMGFLVTSRARVLTGTSGAITAAGTRQLGITVTKTANKTGRYTIQAVDGAGASIAFSKIMDINVTIFSPTADAAITKDAGVYWTIRGLSEASGLFYLQFFKSDESTGETHADAELENSSAFTIAVVSERNGVSP